MTRARDLGDFIADGAAAELVVDTTTLVVDSTNNRVGIGTASPATALDLVGNATITTADNTAQLTLVSTDADANAGPILKLRRNSASPADNDLIGAIDWTSENSSGDEHDFLNLTARMRDVTAGSEDVAYAWTAYLNGTGREIQSFVNTDASAASMVFNEDSQDIDFRVESDSDTHALFVKGSNDNVGIGLSAPEYKLELFKATGNLVRFATTDDNNGATNPLSISYNTALRVDNAYSGAAPSASGTKVAKIQLGTVTTDGYGAYGAIIVHGIGTGYDSGEMAFAIGSNSSSLMTERFRFGSAGQLGIGGATYGTSGQVLTSGGASAAPTWADAGGGAYELVSKTTISSSTSEVTINGISAPQNQLLILIDALELDAQGNFMLMYRNSSNANLDNSGGINANYPQASVGIAASSSTVRSSYNTQSYGVFLNQSQIVVNGILSGFIRIFDFGIANARPYAMGQMVHKTNTNLDQFRFHSFGSEGVFSPGQTVTGLRFYSINSQNMTSGKIYVYKLL